MCRSIKTLRGMQPPATHDDVRAAALQFVRKVSGYRQPSASNASVFDAAVGEVTAAAEKMLAELVSGSQRSSSNVSRRAASVTPASPISAR